MNRPRRLDQETVEYLKQIEGALASQERQKEVEAGGKWSKKKDREEIGKNVEGETTSEGEEDGDEDAEQTRLLLENVFEELKAKEASAASDRHVSSTVEALVRKANERQFALFFGRLQGYFLHLALNRYSSHILQTLLARATPLIQRELQADSLDQFYGEGVEGEEQEDEDDDHEKSGSRVATITSLQEIVGTMVEELDGEWQHLTRDVSGSHVVRALLSTLFGRLPLAEKRGKNARHRDMYAAKQADELGEQEEFEIPSEFKEYVARIKNEIFGDKLAKEAKSEGSRADGHTINVKERTNLLVNSNAGPVVQLFLRLQAERDGEAVETEIKQALCWDDVEVNKKLVFDIAATPAGSHLLETALSLCSSTFAEEFFDVHIKSRTLEYTKDPLANFVLQSVLQKIANKKVISQVLSELCDAFVKIFENGRSGVVWRLAEACGRLNTKKKSLVNLIVNATNEVSQKEKKRKASEQESNEEQDRKGTQESSNLVRSMLKLRVSDATSRASILVPAARIIKTLLAFEESIVKPILESIVKLETPELLALVKDGTGSRCVVEPVLDGPKEFAATKEKLIHKFKGHYGALAGERFGCYFVQKAFTNGSPEQKEQIVQELNKARTKLVGLTFGKHTLNHCKVDLYRKDETEWRKSLGKKEQIEKLFEDIFETAPRKDGKLGGEEKTEAGKKRKKSKKESDNEGRQEGKRAKKAELEAKSTKLDSFLSDLGIEMEEKSSFVSEGDKNAKKAKSEKKEDKKRKKKKVRS